MNRLACKPKIVFLLLQIQSFKSKFFHWFFEFFDNLSTLVTEFSARWMPVTSWIRVPLTFPRGIQPAAAVRTTSAFDPTAYVSVTSLTLYLVFSPFFQLHRFLSTDNEEGAFHRNNRQRKFHCSCTFTVARASSIRSICFIDWEVRIICSGRSFRGRGCWRSRQSCCSVT